MTEPNPEATKGSAAWQAAQRAIKQWERQGPTHGCLTASVAQAILRFAAKARAAAIDDALQIAIDVANESLPPVLGRNHHQGWVAACGRIVARLHILTAAKAEGGQG